MSNTGRPWNPYVAGALSGLLAVISVLVSGKYLGASTTFVRAVGMIESSLSQTLVENPYFQKYNLVIDWQFMFVVGIVIGSFIASQIDGSFRVQSTPDMWKERFGKAWRPRAIVSFVGGVIAIYGARLAGGCPSGHGLSGLAQMSVSGFIAASCFFIGGIIMARIVYGRG
ncbi:YeeE/YedE thiosulfate transporter family protein [Desulfovibrio sp. UCD-KL4C]|uniref:YeeE/YedE thiosulfate transporter family protein n=1 Tax=Desulfovibrio sp. UCD-KL4C TaxID=2578120 RepID=UPI0025C543A4|nr:YeeE/YedE thiosulfate transporter family protein [Desulfovibrio sp. UCD-KL4C]